MISLTYLIYNIAFYTNEFFGLFRFSFFFFFASYLSHIVYNPYNQRNANFAIEKKSTEQKINITAWCIVSFSTLFPSFQFVRAYERSTILFRSTISIHSFVLLIITEFIRCFPSFKKRVHLPVAVLHSFIIIFFFC